MTVFVPFSVWMFVIYNNFIAFPGKKKKKKRYNHRISNGFTGYNGNCVDFNGNYGPCGSAGNLSPSICGLLKPLNPNGICPKTLQETIF